MKVDETTECFDRFRKIVELVQQEGTEADVDISYRAARALIRAARTNRQIVFAIRGLMSIMVEDLAEYSEKEKRQKLREKVN